MISTEAYTKSSYSGAGSCVEVMLLDGHAVGLRDSKDISKPPHVFTLPEWRAFLAGVRAGEFDLPA
jgi:hypothetical protein